MHDDILNERRRIPPIRPYTEVPLTPVANFLRDMPGEAGTRLGPVPFLPSGARSPDPTATSRPVSVADASTWSDKAARGSPKPARTA